MEEDKKILIPEEPVNNNSEEKEALPDMGTRYGKYKEKKQGQISKGRISTALMKNTASTVNSLMREYSTEIDKILPNGPTDINGNLIKGNTEIENIRPTDENGNLIKLDAMGTKTIYALNKYIFDNEEESVKKYLESAEKENKKEIKERDQNLLDNTPKVGINVISISIDLWGKDQGKRPKKIIETAELIKKIAGIYIPQFIRYGEIEDENKKKIIVRDSFLYPYITIEAIRATEFIPGKKFGSSEAGKPITLNTYFEIRPKRIFFEHNWIGKGSRYFPLPDGILDAQLPSGWPNNTDVLWIGLFPLAATYRYNCYSIRYQNVKKTIKEEDIIDSEKIEQLTTDALTYKNIPFQRLKDIVGYESTIEEAIEEYIKNREKENKEPSKTQIGTIRRIYKRRFYEDIWEGMWALVERGIITDKSSIDYDNETFTFVFSESEEPVPLNPPGTKKENRKMPGGFWSKNPFKKDK
jgi:metal-responsive CopG/Arc/MetJ family transcriptional regulator